MPRRRGSKWRTLTATMLPWLRAMSLPQVMATMSPLGRVIACLLTDWVNHRTRTWRSDWPWGWGRARQKVLGPRRRRDTFQLLSRHTKARPLALTGRMDSPREQAMTG